MQNKNLSSLPVKHNLMAGHVKDAYPLIEEIVELLRKMGEQKKEKVDVQDKSLHPETPHEVFIRLNLFDLSIDTQEKEISVFMYYEYCWAVDLPKGSTLADDYEPDWDPNLYLTAGKSSEVVEDWYSTDSKYEAEDAFNTSMLCRRVKVRAVLDCEMDLHDFPYDTQKLKIGFRSDYTTNFFTIHPNKYFKSDTRITRCNEFKIRAKFSHDEIVCDAASNLRKDTFFPQATFLIDAEREPSVIFHRVLNPMFFLSTITLSTFGVPIGALSDRLSVVLTLLLAVIAYTFVIQEELPNLPYLTFTDKYVLLCTAFQILIVIECYIVNVTVKESNQAAVDKWFNGGFGIIWFLIQLKVVHWRRKRLNIVPKHSKVTPKRVEKAAENKPTDTSGDKVAENMATDTSGIKVAEIMTTGTSGDNAAESRPTNTSGDNAAESKPTDTSGIKVAENMTTGTSGDNAAESRPTNTSGDKAATIR